MTVPSRAVPAFAPIERLTIALALPVAPFETVIHDALLAALHAQPLVVVTATE